MKNKIKVLIANDSHFLGTGYGVYGKELLTRLHNSGKYEVAEIGCYSDGKSENAKKSPWRFYPAIPDQETEAFKQYKSNNVNQFGSFVFGHALLDFQPHIVFDIRDYWMYAYQEIHPYRPFYKWVVMPTVDSAPQKEDWLYTFSSMDCVIPYTKWAKETLQQQCGSKINLFSKVANAGINVNEYTPNPNKKIYQKNIFGKNVDITGMVMRNQKRKLFPDILSAYRKYLNKLLSESKIAEYDRQYLYIHTSYPEPHGWDIPKLLLEHDLLDKVYFTYICKNCHAVFPSKFSNSISMCNTCSNISAVLPSANTPVPTEKLKDIYNYFDLFVQYAICEGFGMPQIEAASCGVPIASVDYSAMSEIVENLEGYKIPVQRMFRELETDADRAYPDKDATVEILYDFHINKTKKQKQKMSEQTRKLCETHYTWDQVYSVWDECFSSIDLSDLPKWDSPRRETNHSNISVPSDLDPYGFVAYIINNIIKEPFLLKTSPVNTLLKHFADGVFAQGGGIRSIKYSDVTSNLEKYLNNKIAYEDMRTKK
jgi:glycosyltransferase involved in cell wall biosynthesis